VKGEKFMKVCIPVKENRGLESIPFNHFGSAPFFLICDIDTNQIKIIENEDLHHAHGMCQPLKALGGEAVDAILVGGIGAGALMKLNNQGIKVYRVEDQTAAENINMLKQNTLKEFSANNSCNHHDCGH
jgi:predicted Fe-Mo cluster-binding NifX family protein